MPLKRCDGYIGSSVKTGQKQAKYVPSFVQFF